MKTNSKKEKDNPVRKDAVDKNKDLKTQPPLAEKYEAKKAEDNLRKGNKKH